MQGSGNFLGKRKSSRVLKLFLLVAALALNNCGGGNTVEQPLGQTATGTVAVMGTDAPLPNILAFRVTLTGLTLSDGTNTVSVITGPQEIEFSRLNGLRNLLDLRSIPVGTYTSLTASFSSPVISVLDTSVSPPVVSTINLSLALATINVPLAQPLVITDNGLAALLVDLRLGDSIMVDVGGQITGQFRPRLTIRAIPPDAPEAEVDELRGSVVSVDLAGGTFVMQGPMGRQITVVVDTQTQFTDNESLSTLGANTLVEVSGFLQRGTNRLRATEVEVLTRDRFAAGGLITFVNPASGPADSIDVLIRSELPDLSNVQVGGISTLAFDGNERFLIHDLRLPFSPFLFDRASLVAGQRVVVAGAINTDGSLDTRRVILHQQGLEGGWVPGSNGGPTFLLRVAGVTGALFGQPVRVVTSDRTRFVGLSGVGDLTGPNPIPLRVVGLVLKHDTTGNPVVVVRIVERRTPTTP